MNTDLRIDGFQFEPERDSNENNSDKIICVMEGKK